MKNEKFLQMLGEIDEKHLREANKDVDIWLEGQNGVKFTVERPSKKSPRKIITAVSLSAAAVIGAFVLVSNIPNIRNIMDTVSTVYSNGNPAQSTALSEQLADYRIENLDFNKTTIIENTPNSGQWKRLSYETRVSGEKYADKLVKVASDYGVTIDKNDIMVANIYQDYSDIRSLNEVDLSQYTFDIMFYNSDDLYIETIPSCMNWIELNNKKNIKSALGIDMDNERYGTWRPNSDSTSKRYVDPNNENATCVLDGKTIKVADAVRNAQKIISESDVFPKGLDPEVKEKILVYTYENGNQGLWIEFTYTLDGVSFMSPSDQRIDGSKVSDQAYSVHFFCGMLTENTLDWIWQYIFDGATEYTSEECEVNISLNDALKLVSTELDRDDMFIVREIQLVYADRFTNYGNTLCIEPTWMIWLSYNEETKTERLYAYVSAVDGKIGIFETKP